MTAKTLKKKIPRGPGRLTAEQTADLTDRLLDAALRVLSEKGYAHTTMEQIAKSAGASTKTVYSRYENKSDILRAVIRRTLEQVTAARTAEAAANLATVDPATFLSSIGRQVTRITMTPGGATLNRLAFGESRRIPEIAAFYREAMNHTHVQIREALQRWKKEGLFTALDDIEVATQVCHSMLSDRSRIWTALGLPLSEAERETRIAAAVNTFLRGCGYRGAKVRAP